MEKFEISKQEYAFLKRAALKLRYLEYGGVDNWEWYGESLNEEYYEELEKLEKELN